MKKIILLFVVGLLTSIVFAQKERTLTLNKETNLIDVVYYHDNGLVSQTGSYTPDGKLEGEWLSYNEEGTVVVKAFYKAGKKVGTWVHVIDGVNVEVDYSKNDSSL